MNAPDLEEAFRLHTAGRHAESGAIYAAIAARDAGSFEAWAGLGHAARAESDHAEAISAMRRALALRPKEAWLRVNLAGALMELGHMTEAMAEYALAIEGGGAELRAMALRNRAILAPGDPATDARAILGIRRAWARAEGAGLRPLRAAPAPGAKLRIGYYGAFFARKNWMKMYMGVINAHDRARFEVNLIVDGPVPDAAHGYRDHAEDRIWDVTGVPNERLARIVAEAPIDVLVDLNGYSHAPRLPLLLHRAAPVQVAWNGMFATTGFPHLDALIADRWTVLPGEEGLFTEPLRRVAGTYLPFDVFYPTPPVLPPPCLARGQVTFGSLASAYKLTDATIAAWSAVLRACPGARMLVANKALDRDANRAALVARFAAEGIAADRLALRGGAPHDDFLRNYDAIDIALDSFPYNGGTTTVEAIWQGVPLLTTIGDRWAGRTSRSILMAAGLGDDVAADVPAFVALAARLAAAPGHLAARRAVQRARVAASPAADPAALCRELEAIYLDLASRRGRRGATPR